MANSRVVCLLLGALFCADLSFARQLPKECSKGPDYWCKNLKQAAECGAVGHCTSTVWEPQQAAVRRNNLSDNQVDLSFGRHLPKECSKGPDYWCKNLKQAAECGAVGHCTSTVWEPQQAAVRRNDLSDKFVKLFRQLKDVKDLINEEYLGTRVAAACSELPPAAARLCRDNTAHLDEYLAHVLNSQASADTMCRVVGMCDNEKLDNVIALNKKKLAGNEKHKEIILGAEKCVWGPSYWCSNITTSHKCKATHHCVERVWPGLTVPEDTDSICKICKDMVKQARDQLESNQTQEDLKAVFEGSCKLIPIKLVREECDKLADEFVPDLVETLASQMNPQVVCSVAGLCNNQKIDQILEQYNAELEKRVECGNCLQTVGVMRGKFDQTSYDDFLVGLLKYCRGMGSFSDSCSMLVFQYYEHILSAVRHDLKPRPLCHVSGQCAKLYHTHEEYEFPAALTDPQPVKDVPCEFCEQLVTHLRDVLVANTTGEEFYKVLKGLCRQTGSFSAECLSLAEQYYPLIYNYLVSDLKPKEICSLMGICPGSSDVTIAPLVPTELKIKLLRSSELIGAEEKKINDLHRVKLTNGQTNVRIVPPALPLERMLVSPPQTKAGCSLCKYIMHYLQLEISDIRTEDEIKTAVENACNYLPKSVEPQCRQFVAEFGPAVIAMLVQEIDPDQVCPLLGLCAAEAPHVTVNEDKANCPLCLFAVEQLEALLKNNKTESSIRTALDGLCAHLSTKLQPQCKDFVDTYSQQLVEALVADMDAQEVCVFLKLCSDNSARTDPLALSTSSVDKFFEQPRLRADRNRLRQRPQTHSEPEYTLDAAGDIESNIIPDDTVNGRPVKEITASTACIVCEFVLKEIDDQIKDKHNDDEIKKIVHGVCKHMPKSVKPDCDQFVEKYADLVIRLLAQELNPDEVCREIKLCHDTAMMDVKEAVLDCAVCETVVLAVKKVLTNDKADRNIVHIVEKSCALLPAKYNDRCHSMLEIYGASIVKMVEELGAKSVCQKIGLCGERVPQRLHLIRAMNKH